MPHLDADNDDNVAVEFYMKLSTWSTEDGHETNGN